MPLRPLLIALFALAVILSTPLASAAPQPGLARYSEVPPPVIEDPELHGGWELVSITYRDETEEAVPGATVFTFDSDGRVFKYQNGELVDEGSYHIEPNQRLRIWSDRDQVAEEARYRIEDGTLTFLMELEPSYDIVIRFRPLGQVEGE